MAEEKSNSLKKKESTNADPGAEISTKEKQIDEILARARQTIKPILNREAANEIVSDDLLNFRMKVSRHQE